MILFICTIGDIYMKITKNYLKNLIKEELGHLQEAESDETVEIFTIKFTNGTPNTVDKTSIVNGIEQKGKFISAADHIETLQNLQKTLNSPVDPSQGGKYGTD